jgi:hypothetical protein
VRLLTPPGAGGVAVVAFDAGERDRLLTVLQSRSGGRVDLAAGAPPLRCTLQLDDVADDVLAVDRGERGCELHLHGSDALLDLLAVRFGGFTAAAPTAAERLLRSALSPAQVQLACEQRALDFDASVARLRQLPPPARAAGAAAALARSTVARALAEPQAVVLIGAQNAGKSTLFNVLAGHERALAGPRPGLTRDPVRQVAALDGYPYELVDTAGEGATEDAVDRDAIAVGRQQRRGAICLLLIDGSRRPSGDELTLGGAGTLVVRSKSDLPAAEWPASLRCDLAIRCATAADRQSTRSAVAALLRARRDLPPAGPVGGLAALDPAGFAALTTLLTEAGPAGG